jgi:phosphoribosylformylglycinamidine synthase subunit PurQ / glutaminase
MKFGVVVFPGSNCDKDMQHVLGTVLNQDVKMLWHKEADLQGLTTADCIVLPGGFSYGDYLRCGAIAQFSPIMKMVIQHAENGGYVFGVCNGFQILCESGLLPGVLLRNCNQKFICKNSYLKSISNDAKLCSNIAKDELLKIPIAHAEGRYFADDETIKGLIENDQILFKYCDENGAINEAANPNGTILNIAGICNHSKNVFGMMPHPERAAEKTLSNIDGLKILANLIA